VASDGFRAEHVFQFDTEDPLTDKAVAKALGEELRRAREKNEWSRAEMVRLLPSGIGDRTLLAYEHGLRQLTVIRLLELTGALGVGAPIVLAQAMQRASIHLENLSIRVDLRALLQDNNMTFRPMFQWAKNRLNDVSDGVVEVTPPAVRDLAAFIGKPVRELARYLAQFMPDPTRDEIESNLQEESTADSGADAVSNGDLTDFHVSAVHKNTTNKNATEDE
jgi:transcriptional regulator with XRE-family HTH domain